MKNVQNFNDMASDKRWVNLMGAMKTTRQDLQQLAPNPNRRGQKGAEKVQDDQRSMVHSDRDATLGSLLMESFMGGEFGAAIGEVFDMPEWTHDVDWGNTIQAYDEFQADRAQSRLNKEERAGQYSDRFNITAKPALQPSAEDKAWERYLRDLPDRRALEQNLGAMNREMERMEKRQMKQQKLAFSM